MAQSLQESAYFSPTNLNPVCHQYHPIFMSLMLTINLTLMLFTAFKSQPCLCYLITADLYSMV